MLSSENLDDGERGGVSKSITTATHYTSKMLKKLTALRTKGVLLPFKTERWTPKQSVEAQRASAERRGLERAEQDCQGALTLRWHEPSTSRLPSEL